MELNGAGRVASRHSFLDRLNETRWQAPAAIGCGAISATGFEPLHWWLPALAGFAGMIALVFAQGTASRAALIGWLFGVAHFTIGNNWIATAFTYQAAMPGWLGWIAVFLLSLYLAIYPALAALGAWAIARHSRPGAAASPLAFLFAFAACWLGSEYLRAEVFTGFAWNPVGMIALGGFTRPGLALTASWLGTYGVSALVILLAGCWWLAARVLLAPRRRTVAGAALLILPPVLMLAPFPAPGGDEGTLDFTLVQPDIRQEILNEPAYYEQSFLKTVALTGMPSEAGDTRLVVWPESAVPDYLRPGYPARYYRATTFAADPAAARGRIATLMGPGTMLLTGAIDLVMNPAGDRAAAAKNVVTALGPDAKFHGSYAKAHLVPYGEYLPMREILEPLGLSRLVPGTLDFQPGPGPQTLNLGNWGKAGVQICYEIVFSGEVVDAANRPDYIMNPSNDGWFGAWGPPQHLAQARMRAIEEGLPVLRPTTTGISAVVDAGGVVRQFVPRHTAASIDGKVPPALAPTLYARMGIWLSLAWGIVLLIIAVVAMRRHRVY